MKSIKVKKLCLNAKVPTRAHATDAGLDLYALEDSFVLTGNTIKVSTGVALDIPEGYVGKIEDRSSMAAKGLRTGGGVVDAGYNGDVTVVLHNLTNRSCKRLSIESTYNNKIVESGYKINAGDKIAQILIYPVVLPQPELVEDFFAGERGESGFGGSGI